MGRSQVLRIFLVLLALMWCTLGMGILRFVGAPPVYFKVLNSVTALLFVACGVSMRGIIFQRITGRPLKLMDEENDPRPVGGAIKLPAEVRLLSRISVAWHHPLAAHAAIASFDALGFTQAGAFEIQGSPGFQLKAFLKTDEGLWGVVYEVPAIGVWSDLFARFQGDQGVTFTNAPRGQEIDHYPGHEKFYLPGFDVRQLYEAWQGFPRKHAAVRSQPSDFQPMFEQYCNREILWRNARGGASLAEIRRVAAPSGRNVTERQLSAVQGKLRQTATVDLRTALITEYARQAGRDPDEVQNLGSRLVFVHDQLTPAEAVGLLTPWVPTDDVTAPTNGATARDAFSQANAGLPIRDQFTRVGQLTQPLNADVYLAPDAAN